MRAVVHGTAIHPELELIVELGDVHARTGEPIEAWIRAMPRVRRDLGGCWSVIDPGLGVADALESAGFTVDDSALGGKSLADVAVPLVMPDGRVRDTAFVHPRLAGVAAVDQALPEDASYDPSTGSFRLSIESALRLSADTFDLDPDLANPPRQWPPKLTDRQARAVRRLAAAQDLTDPKDEKAYAEITEVIGDVPEWFGLDLEPFQKAGAVALAGGHGACCDPPGLGKTRQLLAALAVHGSKRSVIVTPPPPVVTHWERETEQSGIAAHTGPGGRVVVWQSGRKLPALPETGVLIVPDSLLSARPELIDQIAQWRPDGFAIDEVHRAKTWWAKRSQAVRSLAKKSGSIRIAASGTPMLANVHEMASMLSITGDLRRVFGGLAAFEDDYCYQNRFGGWNSRKKKLPELKQLLDEHVWVRRQKIMPTEKRRFVSFIEPNAKIWREANADVYKTIDRFIGRFGAENGRYPGDSDILAWAAEEMGLVTLMRRAAGLAKVDGIAEKAAEWVEAYTDVNDETGEVTYLRPLIIWTWHQSVSEALAKSVPARIGEAGVIIGSTKRKDRDRLVDAYQSGEIPVLVCSIPTVGVGVTLTRGHDAWLAETSWTPAEISQAEDRQWRIGQMKDVQVTTFIAPGTLDERIQNTLARKSESLELVLAGGDNDVGVLEASTAQEQAEILLDIVKDRIKKHHRNKAGATRKAAA